MANVIGAPLKWKEHEAARLAGALFDPCGDNCPRDPAHPCNGNCGWCHTCGAKLPQADMTWCPTCGSSDEDE